jgi:PAS domain S-box-containing protein
MVNRQQMKIDITEELKQRNKELLILNSVITSMHQYLNLAELLEGSLEKVLEIMSIASGAMLLLDEDKAQFVVAVTKGFSPKFVEKISVLDADDTMIGKTICSGNHLLMWEGDDSRLSSNDWLTEEHLNTLFFLPLKTKQKVYGLMICGHPYSRFFSTRNIDVLENIGKQLALLLENSMPYKEIKESQTLYQNLIESVDVGILSFDKEGKIFQCNKKASKLFDLAEGEGIGRSFKEIIPKKHVHLIDEIIHNYSNALGNDSGTDQKILACRKSAGEQEVPVEISYTIWGERVNPTITATIRDMRSY